MTTKFEVFPTLSLKTFTHFTFPLRIYQTNPTFLTFFSLSSYKSNINYGQIPTSSGYILEPVEDCQGHSHPSAPSVKVSTLTSSLSGLPVTAPVGCPVSTKDESKARIPKKGNGDECLKPGVRSQRKTGFYLGSSSLVAVD